MEIICTHENPNMADFMSNPDSWFEHVEEIDTTDALLVFMKETYQHPSFDSDFAEQAGVIDIFFTLSDCLFAERRFDDFINFRDFVKTHTPQYFDENFSLFDENILKYALFIGDDVLMKRSFEGFINDPNADIDIYLPNLRLIALYGKSDWVEEIVVQNYKTINDHDGYVGAPALDLAKCLFSTTTEKEYLKYKKTGVFDTVNWLKKLATVQLDLFSEEDVIQIELAITDNIDLTNFQALSKKEKGTILIYLGLNFSKYAFEKYQMPFIISCTIWDLMMEFWFDKDNKSKIFFNLETKAFDKFCVDQMGFFRQYVCNAVAATYGASYVYEYLLNLGLINDFMFNTALSSIKHNKDGLLNTGNYVWQNGFIKEWKQAESTSTVEHENMLNKIETAFKTVEIIDIQKSLNLGFNKDGDNDDLVKRFAKSLIESVGNEKYDKPVEPKKWIEVRTIPKIGRNESCTCGSGRKYKNCCGK